MAEPYQQLGKRVREIRKRRGLTQAQLAEIVGLSDNFISMIERGTGHPTLEVVGRIANVLEVDLPELFEKRAALSRREAVNQLQALMERRSPQDVELLLAIAKAIFDRSARG